jgi:hypothetical protein
MAKMKLFDPKRIARLGSLGIEKMGNSVKGYVQLLHTYAGRFASAGRDLDGVKADPINLIAQATMTLVPNLAFHNPKADVGTEFLPYRPYSQILELAINHLIREIDLRGSLRMMITDAIFMAGFAKVGLGSSSQTVDLDGVLVDPSQAYADRVAPEDMILDPIARAWLQQRIIGNRFTVPREVLLDSKLIKADDVQQLSSRYEDNSYNEAAALSENPSSLFNRSNAQHDLVDLVEIWIPEEGVIVTMPWRPGKQIGEKFLRTVDYEGPERGPYSMLGFAYLPDNILPIAPAGLWYDLHSLINRTARKMGRQADRMKRILAYTGRSWEDAQQISDSTDGETLRVDDIDGIKEIQFGGVSDDAYQYVGWAKQLFSEMAMNVDLLSGSGTGEPTATQAEMVQANTSVRLADMQTLVYDFAGGIMEHLGFFLHTDPLIDLPLVKRTEGVDEQVFYTPEMREGDWLDYFIKVRPYSMARQDPNLKIRRMLELCANVIPALAQSMQILGPAFKLESALNLIGREMGIDELDELIDSAALRTMLDQMKAMIEAGVPINEKVANFLAGGQGGGQGGGGGRPQQPNPMGQMTPGMTPQTETNQARQGMAGELQQTYPSALQLAQGRV